MSDVNAKIDMLEQHVRQKSTRINFWQEIQTVHHAIETFATERGKIGFVQMNRRVVQTNS